MSPDSYYDNFNYIFIFLGMHLCPRSDAMRVFNKVIRISLSIWLVSATLLSGWQLYYSRDLKFAEQIANCAIIGSYVIHYIRKSRNMQVLLRNIALMAPRQDLNNFRRLSRYYVIAIVSSHALYYVTVVKDWVDTINNEPMPTWLYRHIPPFIKPPKLAICVLVVHRYFLHTTEYTTNIMYVFYLFVVKVIVKLQMNFLKTLQRKGDDVQRLRYVWLQLYDIKFEFEYIFTMYPLMTFISMFIWTTTYVASIYEKMEMEEAIVSILTWFVCTLITFYLLHVIDDANTEFERLLHQHMKHVTLKKVDQSDAMVLLIDDVRSNLKFRLTAFGMFDLNKAIILSFSSAIVSISILFVQWQSSNQTIK